jgi:Flp pilus assembly protein TadD
MPAETAVKQDDFQRAVDLHNRGETLEAKKIYEAIIALNPNHFDALQLLGLAHRQLGQHDRAVELLAKAISINGDFAFVHKNLGNALERLDRLDAAVASYDRAIALKHDFAEAHCDRADALKRLDRFDDAIAGYGRAIALKPDFAEAYDKLAVLLNERKRHVEALANFEKAIRLKPDFWQARMNREAAIEDFAQWNLLFRHRALFRATPRLHPPVSYNEHVLHRIIYDRDPRLRIVCDKLAVRELIEQRVGAEFVVPVLGVWERAADIEWNILPDKFVIKPSHGSGPFTVVDRSTGFDQEKLTAAAEGWLGFDNFEQDLEWGYRGIPRRILAEPFLQGAGGTPVLEVQVHVVSGKAKLIYVLIGTKFTAERIGYWYDLTGRQILNLRSKPTPSFALSAEDRQKVTKIAEAMVHDFSWMRVDFYLTDNGIRIGELTAYPHGGKFKWPSLELDEKMGQIWSPDCDLSGIPEQID